MYLISKILYSNGGNLWEKIYNWYQGSLLRELFDHLGNAVFNVEFSTYENLTVAGTAGRTARDLIIGLMFGTIFAAALMYYTRCVHGKWIRRLLREECFSPDRAITLLQAGAFRNPSIRRDLTRGGALSKVTRCVEEEERDPALASQPFKPDFLTARFYIPEDLKYRAEVRYDRSGSGLPQFLLTIVLTIVISVALCRLLPAALTLADWLMSLGG